jgi:hypothetical protein
MSVYEYVGSGPLNSIDPSGFGDPFGPYRRIMRHDPIGRKALQDDEQRRRERQGKSQEPGPPSNPRELLSEGGGVDRLWAENLPEVYGCETWVERHKCQGGTKKLGGDIEKMSVNDLRMQASNSLVCGEGYSALCQFRYYYRGDFAGKITAARLPHHGVPFTVSAVEVDCICAKCCQTYDAPKSPDSGDCKIRRHVTWDYWEARNMYGHTIANANWTVTEFCGWENSDNQMGQIIKVLGPPADEGPAYRDPHLSISTLEQKEK